MNHHFKKTELLGFTLIEMLVSVSILLMVIVGPMTLAQKGMQNAYYANEQLIAIFLAQEAIEAVREKRDTHALKFYDGTETNSNGWIANLPPHCKNESDKCAYNPINKNFESCNGGTNNGCQLKLNSDEEFQYSVGSDSIYTRRVYIKETSIEKGVEVTVVVTWNAKLFNAERNVTLQTRLYDVYKEF